MKAMQKLDGPRLMPRHGQVQALIVLLHGYGADGDDLIALAPHLQARLSQAAFIAPHAPDVIPGQPFGRQWFSLNAYDPNLLRRDPKISGEVFRAMAAGAEDSVSNLELFLNAELEKFNLSPDRLVLIGFSQGTMMALQVGLQRTIAPAGIIGFSGALLGVEQLQTDLTSRPSVLLIHGDADDIVPVEAMFAAANGLAELNVPVEWHVRPGLGHGIDPEGLDLAKQALGRWLDQ